jgi:hypothetical protein
VWTAILFYNVTEVAFKSGLLWLVLLVGAMAVPARSEAAVAENVGAKRLPGSRDKNGVESLAPASANPILKRANGRQRISHSSSGIK